MWWALPIATTAMGLMKQNRQAEDQRKYNLAQSEMTRYSPWTGQKGQLSMGDTGSPFEGAVGGAVQGIGITQSLGGDLGFGGASQVDVNQKALAAQEQSNPFAANYGMNNQKPNLYSPWGAKRMA
jgi:hypothetical protein